MSQLSHDERLNIAQQAHQCYDTGRVEEAFRIIRTLPLAPHLAKVAKELYGKEFLLQNKFNLSEAENFYGTDWINS